MIEIRTSRRTAGFMRKARHLMSAAWLLCGALGCASHARADVIPGPTLDLFTTYKYVGIGFTANVNSVLDSFTFQNFGKPDTIVLVNTVGGVLDSIDKPSGNTSYTPTVDWALAAGTQYYLLATSPDGFNAFSADCCGTLPSDTQISMTQTAIFGDNDNAATAFGGGFEIDFDWAAFNDITTHSVSSTGAVPEPSTRLLLLGLGLVLVAWKRIRTQARQGELKCN